MYDDEALEFTAVCHSYVCVYIKNRMKM